MMLLLHWWITRYTAIVVAAAAMMMAGTALVIVVHVRWKKKGKYRLGFQATGRESTVRTTPPPPLQCAIVANTEVQSAVPCAVVANTEVQSPVPCAILANTEVQYAVPLSDTAVESDCCQDKSQVDENSVRYSGINPLPGNTIYVSSASLPLPNEALYGSSFNPNSAIPKDGRDQCIDNMYIVSSGNPVAALTPATSKVVDDDLEVAKPEEEGEFPILNGLVLPGPKDYSSESESMVSTIRSFIALADEHPCSGDAEVPQEGDCIAVNNLCMDEHQEDKTVSKDHKDPYQENIMWVDNDHHQEDFVTFERDRKDTHKGAVEAPDNDRKDPHQGQMAADNDRKDPQMAADNDRKDPHQGEMAADNDQKDPRQGEMAADNDRKDLCQGEMAADNDHKDPCLGDMAVDNNRKDLRKKDTVAVDEDSESVPAYKLDDAFVLSKQ